MFRCVKVDVSNVDLKEWVFNFSHLSLRNIDAIKSQTLYTGMEIKVFTDGSTPNNGARDAIGGIGVFFGEDSPCNYSECFYSREQKITNNMMELMAIQKAIHIWNQNYSNTRLVIYTDSLYSLNCITKWAKSWEKNGWTRPSGAKPENLNLIRELYEAYSLQPIRFVHCNSHLQPPSDRTSESYKIWYGNYKADQLASNVCSVNDHNVSNKTKNGRL